MSDILSSLADWITGIVHSMGYPGIGLLVAFENVAPPIPSEFILPLAGYLAGRGRFLLVLVIAAATAGSVAGALCLYAVGRTLGEDRVRRFVRGYGRFLLLREQDLDRAIAWFDRHGGSAVFFGRLVPVVRSGISIPAGVERMPFWRFVVYSAAGSALWNTALVAAGWALGDQWERVSEFAQWLSYAALALIAIAAGWLIRRRIGASD